MTAIPAAMVGKLRAQTDAPMMECKKALIEADGDMVCAEEILRVKLGSKVSRAESRITSEGVISTYIDGGKGAMVEINCETDFVSKNDDFLKFSNDLAKLVAENNPSDVAALSALPLNGKTVDQIRTNLIGKIGENITIRRFQCYETSGKLAAYLHDTRIGVVVEYDGAVAEVGKNVAMHIAAMRPVAVSSDQVSLELIERERKVAAQKGAELGKSEEIVDKMVEGSVQKFLKEVSLFNQTYVKDDKVTVEQMLKAHDTTVKGFTMFVVGEGIEKKQDDFATEVAAQMVAAKRS